MNNPIYIFNGNDITMNVFIQIRDVINIIKKESNIDFLQALSNFYDSDTYLTLKNVENGLWAESAEYIADRYYEEINNN